LALAAVAAAIVVLAAAGYVLADHGSVPDAGATPGYTAARHTPAASATVPQTGSHGRATSPAGGANARSGAPVVAFLGDDYTTGAGASSRAKRFSTLVSRQLGVVEKNFGLADAGYAKSVNGQTYADRVAAVVAAHPDVVVVSGGRNDTHDNMATLAAQAHELFATLHAQLPDAVLVAIAPWWGDSDHPAPLEQVAQAVRSAVQDAGGHYLALPDPLHGHPGWMADAADPNDTGYAHLADAVTVALAPLIPGAAR
jgi:lysophospholipase L1-like esterase